MSFAKRAAALAGMAGALLGWRPDEFWRATPTEMEAVLTALAGGEATAPLDAAVLRQMMERDPDG